MSVAHQAQEQFGDMVSLDEPLAPHTTYRLGGPAAMFARPRSVGDLCALGRFASEHRVPVLVLGRGSNLLVADAGFDGLVVSLEQMADADRIVVTPDHGDGTDVGAPEIGRAHV